MNKSTARLVSTLRAEKRPGDYMMDIVIAAAQIELFHAFDGPLETPVESLADTLHQANYPGLAVRALLGEFDATPQEASAWVASEEGQAAMRALTAERSRRP